MDEKNVVCLVCPVSCRIDCIGGKISGNRCHRGFEYAVQEMRSPKRILTALMKVKGSRLPLSVRSSAPIDKSLLLSCAVELRKHHPHLPVFEGDILIQNILSTGVDIVATIVMR